MKWYHISIEEKLYVSKSLRYLAFFTEFFVFVENKANDIAENDDFPLSKAKLKKLLFG